MCVGKKQSLLPNAQQSFSWVSNQRKVAKNERKWQKQYQAARLNYWSTLKVLNGLDSDAILMAQQARILPYASYNLLWSGPEWFFFTKTNQY